MLDLLSDEEKDVLFDLATISDYQDIADDLGIDVEEVRNHVKILKRLFTCRSEKQGMKDLVAHAKKYNKQLLHV